MAINVSTLAPASIKSKNVATEQYVDSAVTTVNAAMQNLVSAEEARDGQVVTYYQTTAPSSGMKYGDYWLDIDDGSYTTYRYQNTNGYNVAPLSWCVSTSASAKAIQNAYRAEKVASSKVTTFYQGTAPTALTVGDLWVDTANSNALKRWNGSSWATISVDVSGQLPTTINSTVNPSGVYPAGTLWRKSVTVNGVTQYDHWISAGGGTWNYIGGTYVDGSNIVTGSINAAKLNVNDIFSQNITYTGTITGGSGGLGGKIRSYNGAMEIDLVNGSIYIA